MKNCSRCCWQTANDTGGVAVKTKAGYSVINNKFSGKKGMHHANVLAHSPALQDSVAAGFVAADCVAESTLRGVAEPG